jgi:hypothetical protein
MWGKKTTEKLSFKFEQNKRCVFFFFFCRATPIISLVSREWNSCESLLSWQTFVSRTKADALGGFKTVKMQSTSSRCYTQLIIKEPKLTKRHKSNSRNFPRWWLRHRFLHPRDCR